MQLSSETLVACHSAGCLNHPQLLLPSPATPLAHHCFKLAAPVAQVRELERRKAEDVQRREQQAVLAAEKARIEAERAAKTK